MSNYIDIWLFPISAKKKKIPILTAEITVHYIDTLQLLKISFPLMDI